VEALIGAIRDQADGGELEELLNRKNNISGATPLHCAANSNKPIKGRLEAAQALLAAGADPNVADSYGVPPVDYTDDEDMRRMLGGTSLVLHDAIKE
jgi:hypothetical protein